MNAVAHIIDVHDFPFIAITVCVWLDNCQIDYIYFFRSTDADESRQYSPIDTGFVPIIPTHLNPIYAQQNFYRNFFHSTPSTSRPFAVRHITTTTPYDESLLGSGDFTIMKGGTFYPEGEEKSRDYGSEFYDSNSGRPAFALALERPHQRPDDPFENFKDFADLTAGVDTDFSHLSIVYVNKSSTKHEPRNILEQLELIDQQKKDETEAKNSAPIKSGATLSKFKTKLRSTKLQKEYKKFKVPKSDYVDSDPLVADS